MKYIIGVDIGATKISAALVFGSTISKIVTHPTESSLGKATVISNIKRVIKIFDNRKVKAISLGIAGEIDYKRGVLVFSPNMRQDIKNIPLVKIIKKEFKKEVFLENDAKCFALAESIAGAGKNARFVVGLTLGTGVGGGIIIDKKIYYGNLGLAGEFGHMTIAENGYECGCHQRGHLEVYASGTGMMNLYKKFTGKDLDTFEIEKLALAGDIHAKRVFKIMSDSLGIGLANIINTLNPDMIIIGGGLVRVKALWRPSLALAKKSVVYQSLKNTEIVKTALKDKANILGAALIASQNKKI